MSKQEVFWAYLAGFIDGEGCFIIQRIKTTSRSTPLYFQPMLVLAQAGDRGLEALRFIQTQIRDCSLGHPPLGPSNRTERHVLNICAIKLRSVLPKVYPYLHVKKHDAEIMLKAVGLINNRGSYVPSWKLQRLAQLREELSADRTKGRRRIS